MKERRKLSGKILTVLLTVMLLVTEHGGIGSGGAQDHNPRWKSLSE